MKIFFAHELGDHVAVIDDRPGYEMREDRDEHQICDEGVSLCLAAVGIDDVCCLCECEERYAQW